MSITSSNAYLGNNHVTSFILSSIEDQLVDLKFDNADYSKFQRTLLVFNGSSESELTYARALWKKLKPDSSFELKYFLQNDKGIWEEKKD